MSDVVIFAASDLEYNSVKMILTDWKSNNSQKHLLAGQGYCGKNLVELFCTKMGPKNATLQASIALEKTSSKVVLITGLAGGLAEKCKQGDLVIYSDCHFLPTPQTKSDKIVSSDKNLVKLLANSLQKQNLTLHQGSGLTLSWVVCQAKEKLALAQKYNTIAVDMESYQILNIAREKNCPAAVVRVISDGVEGNLPDLNAAMNNEGEVNNLKMLIEFSKHPVLAAKFLFNLNKAVAVLKNSLPKVLASNFNELC